jgi:hypothetical protein
VDGVMKLKIFILGLGCIFIVGCESANQLTTTSSSSSASSHYSNFFDIKIPEAVTHQYIRDDESVAYTTFEAPANEYKSNDYSLVVYPPQSLPADFACTESNIGVSKAENFTAINSKTILGKVTFTGYDYPPNFIKCSSLYGDNAATYAFCSEKDEKRVVICVSQMTDNPTLAKEIFETFRWTE